MHKKHPALPTPRELAEKITEDDIVTLSLRVKTATKLYFERLAARDKSLSVNNMINAILESYVQLYQEPEIKTQTKADAPIAHQMHDYMLEVAKQFAELDDEVLLARACNDYALHFGRGEFGSDKLSYGEVLDELERCRKGKDGEGTEAVLSVWTPQTYAPLDEELASKVRIMCYAPNSANFKKGSRQAQSSECHYDFETGGVSVSCVDPIVGLKAEYWPLVVGMLHAYLDKLDALGWNKEEIFTPKMNEEIAQAVNSASDRAGVARAVAEVLAAGVDC